MEKELDLDEQWHSFAQELIQTLKSGTQPSTLDMSAFETAMIPQVVKMIERFKNEGNAFICSNRQELIKKLIIHHRKIKLKSLISQLKARLSWVASQAESVDELPSLLNAIKTINSELVSIENSNTVKQ